MTAYYNEIDPYAAQWLRNLIAAGHIASGDVDERSIVEVQADDLKGYRQAHFFAGIGGWSVAARLAGWPDDRPLWTGSCPCQPFSVAGRQHGNADERHLWPVFASLIAQCRPAVVAGEQVASPLGRDWLAGVRTDLEALGYAVGAADLCAASVGAPHIRQRLYWLGNAVGARLERHAGNGDDSSQSGRLSTEQSRSTAATGSNGWSNSMAGRMADADDARFGWQQERDSEQATGQSARQRHHADRCSDIRNASGNARRDSHTNADAWNDHVWIDCADGKARRIEPGLEPLAHGISNRVGRLRAYGNAIVPQVAAQFLMAAMP